MKATSWRSVSGGLIALVLIIAVVVAVLRYARTGVLHGDKFRLYVAVPDASNLLPGSEVWLNGQRIGSVTRIDFAPATVPKDVRVVIATDVLADRRETIRFDSRATLRSGGTLIGAPVVWLSAGTLAKRAVVPGDTLRGAGPSDFEIAASRVTESLEQAPAILADAKVIMGNAKRAGSRLGAIMNTNQGTGSFSDRSHALMATLTSNRGSASRLMRDQQIRRRVEHAMAGADSVRGLLASRMEQMGRFKRDSTLARAVGSLREDVAELRRLAASPNGTVGRMTTDSALVRSLDSVFVELSALMADIKKNPLRYAKVF
jgi:phospholipid/cholesterol/gamma-HCH transport system substrate-binding protein